MRHPRAFLLSMTVIFAFAAGALCADTRYVTEEVIVTVRSGTENDSKALRQLKSAAPVEVLEERGDYLKVKTEDGVEGWVQKKYIVSGQPKALKIKELEKKLESLQAKTGASGGQPSGAIPPGTLTEEAKKAKEEASRTSKELQDLTAKYNTLIERSGRLPELSREYDRSKEENQKLRAVEEHLKQENERLVRKSTIYWFLVGAGVFFVGWVAGKLSRQRRRF